MSQAFRFLILGAGQAGYWAARTLRDLRPEARVDLVGDEKLPPYERPQLSKQMLRDGSKPVLLEAREALADRGICWHGGRRAMSIDRGERLVALDDGTMLQFDRLLLATGGRSRTLSVPGLVPDVTRYLRTVGDALKIQRDLASNAPLLIIGGGWIGLEVAAAARGRNVPVTLVEASDALCSRALPADLAQLLEARHSREGVDIRLGTVVDSVQGECAILSDGSVVPFGTVLVGVGMHPNDELAVQSGIEVGDGILVDGDGQTSDPAIYATGDVARYRSEAFGPDLRPESWSHAQNHAVAVATSMAGGATSYDPAPWFWSDQYDLNLQLVGVLSDEDEKIIRGTPGTGDGSIFYLRDCRLRGAASFNRARENRIAKRLIETRADIDAASIADPAVNLQSLLT